MSNIIKYLGLQHVVIASTEFNCPTNPGNSRWEIRSGSTVVAQASLLTAGEAIYNGGFAVKNGPAPNEFYVEAANVAVGNYTLRVRDASGNCYAGLFGVTACPTPTIAFWNQAHLTGSYYENLPSVMKCVISAPPGLSGTESGGFQFCYGYDETPEISGGFLNWRLSNSGFGPSVYPPAGYALPPHVFAYGRRAGSPNPSTWIFGPVATIDLPQASDLAITPFLESGVWKVTMPASFHDLFTHVNLIIIRVGTGNEEIFTDVTAGETIVLDMLPGGSYYAQLIGHFVTAGSSQYFAGAPGAPFTVNSNTISIGNLELTGAVFENGRWRTLDTTPEFTWDVVTNGPQTQARLVIKQNSVGTPVIYDSGFVSTAVSALTCAVALDDGDYIAEVTAKGGTPEQNSNTLQMTFILGEVSGGGCPAGYHDDGTGNCVEDDDPMLCATGYYWNGAACVPIPNTYCCPPGETFDLDLGHCVPCGGGEDPDEPTEPDQPDAPDVTKDCQAPSIIVTAPEWDEDPLHATASMQLQRRVNDGTGWSLWQTIHTWNAPDGTYEDEDVEPYFNYEYQARGCNNYGCSEWSDVASLPFQSSTLTVTIVAPANGAILSSNQVVQVQLSDTAEVLNDCDLVIGNGPCAQEDPELTVYLDDNELPLVFTRVAGSPRNGLYEALWDTRNHANGVNRRVKAQAKDVTCCLARDENLATLSNTQLSRQRYIEVKRTEAPPEGQEYFMQAIGLRTLDLNENASRQFWARWAVFASDPGINWMGNEKTQVEKNKRFEELQPVLPQRGEEHPTDPDMVEYHAEPPLIVPGQAAYWVVQFTPVQVIGAHLTGCERIVQITLLDDGRLLVLATSDAPSAAKVFLYEYGALTLLVDLADHAAADVTQAALLEDKLWVIRPGEIFVIDLDENQTALNLAPRGEAREPKFVLSDGEKVFALFVNAGEAPATRCYDMTFAAPRLVWELPDAATFARWQNATLLVACGSTLYSSDDVATLPTLRHAFASDVVDAYGHTAQLNALLANGQLHRETAGNWANVATAAGANMIVTWEGVQPDRYGVIGMDSAQLHEEAPSGAWADGRTIVLPEAMEENVTQILTGERYAKELVPGSGEPGQPGYVAPITAVVLALGTAPDGVLVILEVARLSPDMGYHKTSGVEKLRLSPYRREIPVTS